VMSVDSFSDNQIDHDVIVVGAGLSGLSAARELLRLEPTLRVLVLEAKERVGGKTLSVSMKAARGNTLNADLGGTWITHSQPNILRLIEELGLKTLPQYSTGTKWVQIGTPKWRSCTGSALKNIRDFSLGETLNLWWSVRKMRKLAEKVDVTNPFSWNRADELNEMSLAQWIRQNVNGRSARDALEIAARATYGVEPSRVNMLYHLTLCKCTGTFANLFDVSGGGVQAMRVQGGTEQISKRLAEEIGKDKIILHRVVERFEVDESNGITRVHTHSTNAPYDKIIYTCSQVICAVPLNQCAKISFFPPLPYLKQRLFDSAMPGNLIKFLVTFETAFWREEGWSGEVISTGRTTSPSEVLPVICTYDYTSSSGIPAMIGFMSEEYSDMTKEDRCNAVVRDLMRVFGERAMVQFLDYEEKLWSKEPYIAGAPSVFMPCGTMDSWLVRREPFMTVHFAGAETASKWIGYMEGAVESSLRTVHEVFHQLGYYDKISYTLLKGSVYDSDYKQPLVTSKHYVERIPFWRRGVFFFTVLCLGILVYSKKYKLSYTARAMKPLEKAVVKFSTGMDWP
uniref:Amine oxidase n=1 Tax=Haemonchus contortus TaxID=6289 RepID=A0A7I4YSI0_HAECO